MLYDYIAERDGAVRALGYISRIEARCRGLADFPQQGVQRNEIRPGLRVLGFERRAAIAFRVADEDVTVLRVLYGGRELSAAFAP